MPDEAFRHPSAQAAGPLTVMAFDYGRRRIGVACGDTVSRTATPLAGLTIASAMPGAFMPAAPVPAAVAQLADAPDWSAVGSLLREWEPNLIVVGLPYSVDDSENRMTAVVRSFAAELVRRYSLPVRLVDERYSSLEAAARLRTARVAGLRKRRVGKADVDAAAACIILERWFSEST